MYQSILSSTNPMTFLRFVRYTTFSFNPTACKYKYTTFGFWMVNTDKQEEQNNAHCRCTCTHKQLGIQSAMEKQDQQYDESVNEKGKLLLEM